MHRFRPVTDEILSTVKTPIRRRSVTGVSDDTIEAAVRAGRLVRLAHGVIAAPMEGSERDDFLTRVRVALLRYPSAVVSHSTAARLHGIPYFTAPDDADKLHVIVKTAARRRGDLVVHDLPVLPHEHEIIDDVAVTTPMRTALDIGMSSSMPWAVVALDSIVRRQVAALIGLADAPAEGALNARRLRLATHDAALRTRVMSDLSVAVGSLRRRHGVGIVREALTLTDPTSESPLESLSRVGIHRSGLPTPLCGYEIRVDASTYWADFAWPELGVIGEADGAGKYEFDGSLARQEERQKTLERAGWIVVRWTWDDVFPNPHSMLVRLNEALRTVRGFSGNKVPA